MLTMKLVHDMDELVELATISGVDPHRLCGYVAKEKEKLTGYCLYYPEEYGLHIAVVECYEDPSLFDGLIRATAATLFDRLEDQVTFGEKVDHDLLKRYGFITSKADCIKSANEFLQGCKNCKS